MRVKRKSTSIIWPGIQSKHLSVCLQRTVRMHATSTAVDITLFFKIIYKKNCWNRKPYFPGRVDTRYKMYQNNCACMPVSILSGFGNKTNKQTTANEMYPNMRVHSCGGKFFEKRLHELIEQNINNHYLASQWPELKSECLPGLLFCDACSSNRCMPHLSPRRPNFWRPFLGFLKSFRRQRLKKLVFLLCYVMCLFQSSQYLLPTAVAVGWKIIRRSAR